MVFNWLINHYIKRRSHPNHKGLWLHLQHEPERQLLGQCSFREFPHNLKTVLTHHRHYQTRQEAKQEVFECIEVFYNRQRRHSTIGHQTPLGHEKAGRKVA